MRFASTLAAIALASTASATNVPTLEISEGVFMPLAGLGTWQYNDTVAYDACLMALKQGYTHIDTALGYKNQVAVSSAIKDSGRNRNTFFLTSKIPGGTNTSTTQANLDLAMQQLDVDYVDLMLTHFPATWAGEGGKQMRQEGWKVLEAFKAAGKAKAIGVSHYCKQHIQDILEINTTAISINQVQYHVGMGSAAAGATDDKQWMMDNGITYQAFSSLCGPCNDTSLITGDLTNGIGKPYGKSGAQVALKWVVQQGIPVIPKTDNPEHMQENIDLFDWELSEADMATLTAATTPSVDGGDTVSGDCTVA